VIAELAEDRVVDGLFAVARKQRLRTRGGNPYLALELVDSSGRIDARVWNDVDLLDKRFREGDAVRVLGRVERFRDRLLSRGGSADAMELFAAVRGRGPRIEPLLQRRGLTPAYPSEDAGGAAVDGDGGAGQV